MSDRKIFSVGELTNRIKFVLEDGFEDVLVEGEISNFRVYPSGHAYFSLKDASSVLQCVLFRRSRASLGIDLSDGVCAVLGGRISVYPPRGQYQMVVSAAELKGEGALQLAFERLKRKLFEEGLFETDRKKAIPFYPAHIAVVTSPTGAAVRDMIKVLKRRAGSVKVSVSPALVQGKKAAADLVRAVREIEEYDRRVRNGEVKDLPIELVIIGRGGGSLEDLWAFNDEELARSLASFEIPVISAVGHEIDFTISDLVADLRAATPSAAAEAAVPVREELLEDIAGSVRRARSAVLRRLENEKRQLDSLKKRYVMRAPLNFVLQHEQRLDEIRRRAGKALSDKLHKERARYEKIATKLKALSPLGVLKRGYSITFKSGSVITSAGSIKKGEKLLTRFYKGCAESTVTKSEEA